MPLMQIPPYSRLESASPVILIGMHRSGTSLLTRLMGMLGVFMGADHDPNAESKHFRRLNKHTFHAVQAEWNTPERVIAAMRKSDFVMEQARYYQTHLLTGVGGILYWGMRRWLALYTGAPLPHWGWKDPRTSLTLPIWLQVFPQARVIHIIRNGIDVAISLHRRQLKQTQRRFGPHPDHRDPRGYDFRFCFSLWEQYQSHLLTYRDGVPASQYTEMHYETLLREPEKSLRYLMMQIDMQLDETRLAQAVASINTDRLDNRKYAAAYKEIIPELLENPLMQELGYRKE